VVADDDSPPSPWTRGGKKGHQGEGGDKGKKGALEKGARKPTPSPLISPEPARLARTEKKIITVDSAHPPTTPMLGFPEGSKGKSTASTSTSKSRPAATPPVVATTKGKTRKSPGALLSRKKK
jgi:hypothetical protein